MKYHFPNLSCEIIEHCINEMYMSYDEAVIMINEEIVNKSV